MRFVNCRKFAGNTFEERALFGCPVRQLCSLFLSFDRLPILDHLFWSAGCIVAENMRMTSNEFVADFLNNGVDVEAVRFLAELGLKDDVQKKVAEFFGDAFGIVV